MRAHERERREPRIGERNEPADFVIGQVGGHGQHSLDKVKDFEDYPASMACDD
jgi:hypothetical protein